MATLDRFRIEMHELTMFDKALSTTERMIARNNENLLEYAEWREFSYVYITPGDQAGHDDAPTCWCEPAKFTRASGLVVYVHRRVH